MDWVLEEALSRCEYFQTTTKLQLPTAFQSALCFLQCVLSFFKALEFAWHALQFPCLTCCNAKIKSSKPAQLTATQNASANHLLCDSHATRTQPAVMSMAKELGQRAAHAMGGLTCLNTMIINQNGNVV